MPGICLTGAQLLDCPLYPDGAKLVNALDNVRIVLIEPSHPGNIGAVARAMKNMLVSDLALVQPGDFPHEKATAMASGADDILASARVCDDMVEAIAGCDLVIGTSARTRRLPWPLLGPEAAMQRAWERSQQGQVAIVFGRERSGLTNEELQKCHALVHIPTNPEFSSLNLAQAVQVLVYELSRQSGVTSVPTPRDEGVPLATADEVEGFLEHFEAVMTDIRFLNTAHPKMLMSRVRRLFVRAEMDRNEINIMRGMLSAVERELAKRG